MNTSILIRFVAILTVIFCFNAVANTAQWDFYPNQFESQNCSSSKVITSKYGKCLEAIPNMNGKSSHGVFASAKQIELAPGKYSASFTLSADKFRAYAGNSWRPHWLVCQLQFADGKKIQYPLWQGSFLDSGIPVSFSIPFTVTQKTSMTPSVSWWGNLEKIINNKTMKLRVYNIEIKKYPETCFILSTKADKIFYPLNASAKVNCKLFNSGEQEWVGKLDFEIITGMDSVRKLGMESVTVPPGGEVSISKTFSVGSKQFGHELRVKLIKDGKVLQTISDDFSVAENFWDVALGAGSGGVLHSTGRYGENTPKIISDTIEKMQKNYSNWLEVDFWAPDDWGNMTPEEDEWISGQAARWQNKKYLKELISTGHQYGIKSITYGKGISGGPSAWELLRQSPELFMRDDKTGRWGGNPDLWDFHNWNDPKVNHYKDTSSNWHRMSPDLSKVAALDHGIKELIESSKEYGWDGVRFDGHFTAVDDTVSTHNMRRMKEEIWKELPDYLFGFNLCSIFERGKEIPHEEREAMAGGAHWMQEAIGSFSYQDSLTYKTWKHYAENEQVASRKVQALNGTYHYINRLLICSDESVAYYKFVIGILNSAHPIYGAHELVAGCPNWGRFLTRWSVLFWHPNRKPLDLTKNEISGINLPENLLWKLWAKSIPISKDSEYLVLPFLVLPKTEQIKDTKFFPPVVQNCGLDLTRSPLRSRIESIYWLTPESQKLKKLQFTNGTVKLPEINKLGILIAKLKGCPGYNPINRPKFTEAVSAEKLKKSRASGKKIVVVDPLRPELNIVKDDRIEIQQSEKHSWSMNRVVFEDSDAVGGRASGANSKLGSFCIGAYFRGIMPGAYKITVRVKMTTELTGGFHKNIYENISLGNGKYKARAGTPRSQKWGYVKYSDLNIKPNEFQEIVILGRYEHYGVGFLTVFLQGSLAKDVPSHLGGEGMSDNEKLVDPRFMLDWVKIELIEAYTDKEIAEKMEQSETVTAKVGKRSDTLWIRGMYDDLYNIGEAVKKAFPEGSLTKKYQIRGMPKTVEELAPFGTIIMPNVPVSGSDSNMDIKIRKAYKDWVESGGHLIILGGSMSLGQGSMKGTFLEDILPCEIEKNADLIKLPENSQLTAGGEDIGQIFYAHTVKLKPEAENSANSAQLSLLLTRKAGKGRCTVFAGSVMGAPKNDPKAFWNNSKWIRILDDAIKKQ